MAEERTSQERLAEAIAASAPDVVLGEWVDSDGNYWQTRMTDEQSPTWRIQGLLFDALHNPAREDGD